MAGNQYGKSDAGAAEVSVHLTGQYPDDWKGKRFDHAILCWAGSDTNETTMEICQEKLFGEEGELGTGFIPADCIGKITPSRNLSGAFYKVRVRHKLGGWSTIVFKSYKQGRAKWQGKGVHVIWCDEEPDSDIWGEATARITAVNGLIMLTFTPLSGGTEVVSDFFPKPKSVENAFVRMELDDAQHEDGRSHLSPEMKLKLLTRYPVWQRDARLRGLPILGSGLVYPIDADMLDEVPPQLAPHWRHIVGLDFGGAESPTAFVWLALDPETGVVHLIHVYSEINALVDIHARALVAVVGKEIPVAWPHDVARETGTGTTYKAMYQKAGCNMLRESARFSKELGGGARVEPGVTMILEMMLQGRMKASRMHHKFYEELTQYHRVQGVIDKRNDHVLDALRYGIMSLHLAEVMQDRKLPTRRKGVYDPLHSLDTRRSHRDKNWPTRVN